jgi:hypothetical protein
MGISDEAMAKAIEKQRMLDQITIANPYPTNIMPPHSLGGVKKEDLNSEAMQAPISTLEDLWAVRWGGKWVNEKEFKDDPFWSLISLRLRNANRIEQHRLIDDYATVYRIIE